MTKYLHNDFLLEFFKTKNFTIGKSKKSQSKFIDWVNYVMNDELCVDYELCVDFWL